MSLPEHHVILADTSAWVEYDRASASSVDRRLTELISTGAPVAVTEPVVMEVVAGARSNEREVDLRRLLDRFHLLRFDAAVDFDAAARIDRACRRVGVTPRGMLDCMIAAVAYRYGATCSRSTSISLASPMSSASTWTQHPRPPEPTSAGR